MSRFRYTLLDQRIAERARAGSTPLAEAEETLARFLAHAPEAADDLEIWDEDEGVRVEVDPADASPRAGCLARSGGGASSEA